MTKYRITAAGKVYAEGVAAKNVIRASLEESSPGDERETDEILAAYEAYIILKHKRENPPPPPTP